MKHDFKYNMRAMMGHERPQDHEAITCECGWTGQIKDCNCHQYDNGQWHALSGRKGLQWDCPNCEATVWNYWYVMS